MRDLKDTPRTHALLVAWDMSPEPKALINHAYELEQELNEAMEKIKRMAELAEELAEESDIYERRKMLRQSK